MNNILKDCTSLTKLIIYPITPILLNSHAKTILFNLNISIHYHRTKLSILKELVSRFINKDKH